MKHANEGRPQDVIDSMLETDDEEVKEDLDPGTREDAAGVSTTSHSQDDPGSRSANVEGSRVR